MNYSEWEVGVVESVADALGINHSDASGVVETQDFVMQQSWGKGMDVQQTANKILAAADAL